MAYDPHRTQPRHYDISDRDLAAQFSALLKTELKELLLEVIFFGSSTKGPETEIFPHDIDVLIIIDDRIRSITSEAIEAYRVITKSCAERITNRLHINTLRLSNFIEYVLNGDPIATNILRDGIPLIAQGTIEALQQLQHRGEIKPSEEVIWTYFNKAPQTLINSRILILQATIDLYWAIIEMSHAILQKMGETPHTPEQAIHLINEKLVRHNRIESRAATILRELYDTEKKISAREIKTITGTQYQALHHRAKHYIDTLNTISAEIRFTR
ncbi:hypothetical protein HY641_05250 [Candidatus Woesearchaeota archaeon]|nr:hypothetical protein [Candidatus Woesearchaeota archaeon]